MQPKYLITTYLYFTKHTYILVHAFFLLYLNAA